MIRESFRNGLMDLFDFVDYVYSFYGSNGLYDMNATRNQILSVINMWLDLDSMTWIGKNAEFCYDSTDREIIRDYLIKDFGLVFPD
tara:strand:+ start:217 stop:474 length:258 start_codon:yes stop_codon:yes gene_type:complete